MSDCDSYNERKCYRCGKVFIVHDPSDWVFRRYLHGTDRFFCSWSCIKAFEEGRGTKTQRREKVIAMLKDGLTVSEVCKLSGMDRTNVIYWEKKIRGDQEK